MAKELDKRKLRSNRPHPQQDKLQNLLLYTSLSNKQIAHKMGICEGSIKVMAGALYKRLGVANRVELMYKEIMRLSVPI